MNHHGRKVIYTDAEYVTRDNVQQVVNQVLGIHEMNRQDSIYLYNYWRGITPVMGKTKDVRPEINHKINENRAYEIEKFFQGYTFGEPIQYVRRGDSSHEGREEEIAKDINILNGYMANVSKATVDSEIATWMYVTGTSYRLVLASKDRDALAPFEIYALDPRETFVAYHSGYRHQPVFAVNYHHLVDGGTIYNVYTPDKVFTYSEGITINPLARYESFSIPDGVEEHDNTLGYIPIIEYPADVPRLGVFEVVLDLLDALNELVSNRMDDVVQFVNQFLAILGGTISEEDWQKVQENKLICIPDGVDAKYIGQQMKNTDIQTLKEDLYMAILTICGMPNRNGGTSTSDTGSAVIMRDGWQAAEARAKSTEQMFKKSEMSFLKIVLKIMRDTVGTSLDVTDIEPHFERRNYENIATKSQVLTTMLDNGKIDPELAFKACGMFIDPEEAYLQSKRYVEEHPDESAGNNNNGTGKYTLSSMQTQASEPRRASADQVPKMQDPA